MCCVTSYFHFDDPKTTQSAHLKLRLDQSNRHCVGKEIAWHCIVRVHLSYLGNRTLCKVDNESNAHQNLRICERAPYM